MDQPCVPVLPDPEEDIRILGVPVGRLAWLGPLIISPLILATISTFAGLPGIFPLAVLATLELWHPLYWAVTWWTRRERRGLDTGAS